MKNPKAVMIPFKRIWQYDYDVSRVFAVHLKCGWPVVKFGWYTPKKGEPLHDEYRVKPRVMRPGFMFPIFAKRMTSYDVMKDRDIFGLWLLGIRIRLGWPMVRFGWYMKKPKSKKT